jgi:hypothetical protein
MMSRRAFVQIFILAYAPMLLWASLIPNTPNAASEGAQMRNKHAPPSSKQKDHTALLDSWHTQTLVQAHKRAVEVDHHGSAKKLGHKKAVRTTHSTHDLTEKASAHASGFTEGASSSKNVNGIHAASGAHIRKLHKMAAGHGHGHAHSGFHAHGHHHGHGDQPHHRPHHQHHQHHNQLHHHTTPCRKTNEEIFTKSGWEEHEDCHSRDHIQTWLEQNEIEVTRMESFESFARLQTLTECSELCEKHTGVASVAHSGSGALSVGTSADPGGTSMAQSHAPPHVAHGQHQKRKKPCVAIAHTRAEKGDGTCYLFSDRAWPSELELKVKEKKAANGLVDTSTQALGGEATECGPWKCFLFKGGEAKGESDSIAPN